MDQRSMAILNQISQSDSYISMQRLTEIFNVSRRTVYNDLDKINYWLKERNLSEVKQVRGKGLYLDQATKQEVAVNVMVSDAPYYEFSPKERRAWIYLYIVGQEKPYFLEDMKELFQVSRNTALEDIKQLKVELDEQQLNLVSERKSGYTIYGDESDIRRSLIHYLSIVVPENGWYGFLADMDSNSETVVQPYHLFDFQMLRWLRQLFNQYEKQIEIEFTDEVLNNLVVWFYVFIQRIKQGENVEIDPVEREVIDSTDEHQGAQTLCDRLAESMNIVIPLDEKFYFSKYLLSAKVNYNFSPQFESQEMMLLREVVEKMVSDFQIYAAVEFENQRHMIQNLLLHLKPAYYRIKYGISIENSLRDSVKRNYPEVFHLTEKVIHHFENLIDQPVNENEIAFITMHFGGWLRKEGVILGQHRKKLLIVCTNGLGTSRLLESQLKGLFSDVEIAGVASLREYEKIDLSVDFIVSTIGLPDRGNPVFVVNPVLNNEDKEQLLKKVNSLFQSSSNQQVYSVETVMDMVKRYATVRDEEVLRQELRGYLHSPLAIENEKNKPSLMELLPDKRIIFENSVSTWEEAIKKASEPLLKQGFIQGTYIEKMIQSINEHGPYVVISEQIALPHAKPDDGVMMTGMSMLYLEEPIDVMGKSARIFIVLAPSDNERHLKALAQLTKLFSDKSYKEKVLQANNKEQIINMIRAHSTR
ncbi:BglG family transcription antiterminator [Virgibacillus byunsanensis]|uniref:BglG family transcription antiterminator n=1 Tax=Virgibacillus byunsanensis TaxID=570945 RepID=A0ABW3LR06_9BACI